MARGKYLSLDEARRLGKLDKFCKEYPSEGDAELFDRTLERMAADKPPPSDKTSKRQARG